MTEPAARAHICVSCKRSFSRDLSCLPFCGERCRQVDLGKWLNEEYRVADESEGEGDARVQDEGENG